MPLVKLRVIILIATISFVLLQFEQVFLSLGSKLRFEWKSWESKSRTGPFSLIRMLQTLPTHDGNRRRKHTSAVSVNPFVERLRMDATGSSNSSILQENETTKVPTESTVTYEPSISPPRSFVAPTSLSVIPANLSSFSPLNAPFMIPTSKINTNSSNLTSMLTFNFTDTLHGFQHASNNFTLPTSDGLEISENITNTKSFPPLHESTNEKISFPSITLVNATNITKTPMQNKTIQKTALPSPQIDQQNVSAQLPDWSGCVEPGSKDTLVKKGNLSSICITVSGGDDWALGVEYARWFFRPIADEYSHFTVKNSYKDLVLNDNPYKDEVSVHVSSQQALSFIRRYYDEEQGKIYPYLTAILDVSDGIVNGIAWDDACIFCKNNNKNETRCEENTYDFTGSLTVLGSEKTKGCYLTKKECDKIIAEGNKNNICDLNIYFVWTGSDANGRILSSSGSRWSAFSRVESQVLDMII